jgi:hypothetical protein
MSDESHNLYSVLDKLPGQITEFYRAYFSELRRRLARSNLFFEAVPDFLKGNKRVVAVGGTDGVVVAHFPVEREINVSERGTGRVFHRFSSEPNSEGDAYEFAVISYLPASELVELLSDGEDVGSDITPDVPWGAKGFATPQQKIDPSTGQLAWQAPWSRLIAADFNSLVYWQDPERARAEAREDLEPYIRASRSQIHATAYEELDEVEAPEAIEEAGVEAGDRGVVVEVFERPGPAVWVEYADADGQTKALITYSADLERVLDILPGQISIEAPFEARRGPEPVFTPRVYAAPAA